MTRSRPCKGTCQSRRKFMTADVPMLIAATLTLTGVQLSWGCSRKEKDSANGDPGGSSVAPDGTGSAALTFAAYPNLQNVGGNYRVSINGSPVSVTRTSVTEVVALVAICTHEGAILDGNSVSGFSCPRHGATFSIAGAHTGGPGNGGLTRYVATLSATDVKLKTN